jgi:hypothetical protein
MALHLIPFQTWLLLMTEFNKWFNNVLYIILQLPWRNLHYQVSHQPSNNLQFLPFTECLTSLSPICHFCLSSNYSIYLSPNVLPAVNQFSNSAFHQISISGFHKCLTSLSQICRFCLSSNYRLCLSPNVLPAFHQFAISAFHQIVISAFHQISYQPYSNL